MPVAFAFLSASASAQEPQNQANQILQPQGSVIAMICTNPRGEYLVRYDRRTNSLIAANAGDNTRYRVTYVKSDENELVVVGRTPNDGPFFEATFSPIKRMRYKLENFEQEDGCR